MKKKILSIFFSLMFLFTVVYASTISGDIPVEYETQDEPMYTLWLSTDAQLVQAGGVYSSAYWSDAVSDMNTNFDVDLAWHLGDMIQGYNGDDVAECVWDWSNFHSIYDGLNVNIYKNYTIGNHETMPPTDNGVYYTGMSWKWNGILYPTKPNVHCWINASVTPYGNYTYEFGNILFIILGMEKERIDNAQGTYENQTVWFNETVQANPNKNIIVLNHYIMRNTIDVTGLDCWMVVADDISFRNTIENESNNVVAYFCGHNHMPQTTPNLIVNKSWNAPYTSLFANSGVINHDRSSHSESHIINITNNSKTVTLRVRDHTDRDWVNINGTGPPDTYEYTFDLKYTFTTEETGTTPQFISINGNSNGTTIYNSTPTINWTVIADTSQYWLQIDNNNDFSSPEINITDINQWNYPSVCDINATRVSFTLPTGLSSYDTYYMRVAAYTKT